MPQSKEPALIEHGIALLAAALGTDATRLIERQPGTGQRPQVDWDAYRQVLAPHARDPAPVLDSICAGVSLRPGGPEVEGPCCLRPGPLALNSRALMPTTADEALPGDGSAARADLWAQFTHQWDRAGAMGETGRFERFFYLFQKYTWAVPCSYGEPGVSLFEEWKALAALVFASRDRWEAGPDELLLLVGGDIPGIQEFVYTISSKGAAKGLRGRSLFVQFLGDAVVQRIIADLDLSPANVIYSAGGNFMVLAPAGSAEISGSTVTAQLGRVQATVDAAMLEHLGGDLAACIAWIALPAECVGTDQFASAGAAALKGAIADRKRQRFASAFGAKWTQLFGPQGKPGNRYCVICHRPLARGEGVALGEEEVDLATREPLRRCRACDGFRDLAERVGREGVALGVAGKRPDGGGEAWQEALWSAGGVWYDCGKPAALRQRGATHVYLLNETGFVEAGAHGFRFMAVATPRVTEEDFTRWRQQEGTEREEEGEPQPGVTVRTFGQMADAACGVHRVGVLRMDVDNLGAIMGRGLKPRTLAATSALSRALDLFFAGWLNVLCGETNRKAREERPDEDRGDGLYAIYAGGDDLFVVGSWDLMPVLAARVHDDFKRYTCRNADLSISGGITLEDRKFPLYQAAERAGAAEEAAKAHRAGGSRKDAISFLGLAVKWAEWPEVEERMRKIVRLIQQEQVSKALIQILESIYAQYEAQIPIELERREKHGLPLPDEPASEVYYGPWMWHQAYALTRLAGRGGGKTAQAILDLQADALMPAPIRQSGLAARWAELITRKEREQ